ncbi:angiotensin-converting enzyme [Parasteatoda tepidariorum]|uniref:angiotensin-converting enzyme n=1 Tax=Parasteatoda tepidariorum TaxID=114398 RepID=UPI0039BC44CA
MILPLLFLHVFSLAATTSAACLSKQDKYVSGDNTDLEEALRFLQNNDRLAEKIYNRAAIASWNYQSNLTEANKKEYLRMTEERAKFAKQTWKNATSFAWKNFKGKNETAYRWFRVLSVLGPAALSENKFNELNNIIADMQDVYAKAKVCSYLSSLLDPCTLSIEPELTEILKESDNYYELKHVWSQWRDETGRKMKKSFLRYVDLSNEAACKNGFSDAGEMWREEFESDNITDEFDQLWKTIKPFYEQLHAYVRQKLIKKYGGNNIKHDGPIPAHLLGNMWAQTWGNIYKLVAPYPSKKAVDITGAMKEKKMNARDMFEISEEFFTSLGLIPMPAEFWKKSIIEKPTDRDMVCHASAWNFFNKGDVRIKMCTRVDMEDLITVHHEMGHVEYYLQYMNQPVVFKKGANSGFHEAVGDVLALSVATPDHMEKIGLLKNASHDKQTEINNLLDMALDKIAFVPFGFLIDKWRWKVFDGSIKTTELNKAWWEMRLKYQGVCPPLLRTEKDLDPAAKYHIPSNVPYIRYFISFVIQFQFHKALCEEAGHKGPLHQCDIYQNKKAGKLLSDTLKLGSSVSWREAMKVITKGKTDKMDSSAILEYFRPLYDWLKEQNKNETIGWKSDNPMFFLSCPRTIKWLRLPSKLHPQAPIHHYCRGSHEVLEPVAPYPVVKHMRISIMVLRVLLSVVVLVASVSAACLNKQDKYVSGNNTDLEAALRFLHDNDRQSEKIANKAVIASWNYQSNLTEHNKKEYLRMSEERAKFAKETWKNATSFAWKNFKGKNETAYRWFKALSILGTAALSEQKFIEFNDIIANMQDVYAKAKVCSYMSSLLEPCTLSLEPEVTEIMKDSDDYYELKHVWSQWRDETGRKMKNSFLRYVNLSNEAACKNGFSDAGEMWREEFESDNITEEFDQLWETIKPFYEQLHAYVRRKLITKYGASNIKHDGPIPAHLLGNMWAQKWGHIYKLVTPFPKKKAMDITLAMKEKKMSAKEMFEISEEFFTSLGLIPMTPEFWKKSIIEKPTDRDMVCHASAWNFFNKGDVRIKMCTRIEMESLITVHHEMGHIEYYLQYNDQPVVFRTGANSGFHEAVGDVLALSVSTPDHMKKIGLLKNSSHDRETDINNLLSMALSKIAFVPFGFLIDKWRWKVFDGSIKTTELNKAWWDMRLKYQGVCPPLLRTEKDLDAGAKYHIPSNVPYIRYFISHVIQFQFHKALCEESGYTGPLHQCDIYQNKKAGKLLSDTLKLGSSVSWREAMKVITKGKTDKIDASAILEYFKPLYDWLKEQNKDEFIGWKNDNSMVCP